MFKAIRDAFSAFRRQGQVRRRRNGLAGVPSLGTCHRAPRAPRDPRRTNRTTDPSPPHSETRPRRQEYELIRKQRAAMQQQLETFQAESAAQLKASEEQTLEVLNGLVEQLKTKRGSMKIDQERVREQVSHIEQALQGQLSEKMREKMDQLMELAQKGEFNPYDPKLGGVTREPRDTGRS